MESLAAMLNLTMPAGALMARLGLAVLCGGALGWERQARHKPAGLRTHMMVALGSAGFVLATLGMIAGGGPEQIGSVTRTVQGVVQGIGFLGAGSIIQARGKIQGITSAAGIWVVAGIGVCCGAGLYGLAMLMTAFALLILEVAWRFEEAHFSREEKEAGEEEQQD